MLRRITYKVEVRWPKKNLSRFSARVPIWFGLWGVTTLSTIRVGMLRNTFKAQKASLMFFVSILT
jgi:hypothetical protein